MPHGTPSTLCDARKRPNSVHRVVLGLPRVLPCGSPALPGDLRWRRRYAARVSSLGTSQRIRLLLGDFDSAVVCDASRTTSDGREDGCNSRQDRDPAETADCRYGQRLYCSLGEGEGSHSLLSNHLPDIGGDIRYATGCVDCDHRCWRGSIGKMAAGVQVSRSLYCEGYA